MRSINTEIVHKEVVIIGNGPSGIALSYMLSGNLPYVTSSNHPDDMLSARLRPAVGQCLVDEDLSHLAAGLQGRSTNPVSLLLDSLLHPCADVGIEIEPLVEFKKTGTEIDHVVLGKGPPGGSWHKMDPHILTLSLGSWMSLPGLPFHSRDSGEKRAYASNVAKYYVQYVNEMGLSKNFRNSIFVTHVKENETRRRTNLSTVNHRTNQSKNTVQSKERSGTWLNKIRDDISERLENCIEPDKEENSCLLTNAINYIFSRTTRRAKMTRCHKRPRDQLAPHDQSPTRKIREISLNDDCDTFLVVANSRPPKTDRSISFCCDSNNSLCDSLFSNQLNTFALRNSYSLDLSKSLQVPSSLRHDVNAICDETERDDVNWVVECCDLKSGKRVVYTCRYLVLANGASDMPNRLDVTKENRDPSWLVHDLRSLETQLDEIIERDGASNVEPVLIVGAGLSAADAVIATRERNIPVIHVFRNRSADLSKQLPENMYPEYHKVHQMMQDGGSTYPLYTAYPEYTPTDFDDTSRTVVLTSKSGEAQKVRVSFAAVLIGSRPDLSFLPAKNSNIGTKRDNPIDCKTNTIDINKLTHQVNGFDNLFAVGPLAGDNFVRFIPGGALAAISELYRRHKLSVD